MKVKKPMILEVDNKGAKDLTHNWSVGGRTRHVNVREWFLRDLKEEGTVFVEWISGDENSADLFTKNLQGPLFEYHAKRRRTAETTSTCVPSTVKCRRKTTDRHLGGRVSRCARDCWILRLSIRNVRLSICNVARGGRA
jgi:hypothetical protein